MLMNGSERIAICPYNKAHIVLHSRLQTHLVKCKRVYENSRDGNTRVVVQSCPYDSTHRFPVGESMEEHLKNCNGRAGVVRFLVKDKKDPLIPFQKIELPPPSENWDEEEYDLTYDPELRVAHAPILRNIHGACKSERKTFRRTERVRFQDICLSQSDKTDSDESENSPKPEINSAVSEDPLRFPKDLNLGLGRGRLLMECINAKGNVTGRGMHSGKVPNTRPPVAAKGVGSEPPSPKDSSLPNMVKPSESCDNSNSDASSALGATGTKKKYRRRRNRKNRNKNKNKDKDLSKEVTEEAAHEAADEAATSDEPAVNTMANTKGHTKGHTKGQVTLLRPGQGRGRGRVLQE